MAKITYIKNNLARNPSPVQLGTGKGASGVPSVKTAAAVWNPAARHPSTNPRLIAK